MAAVVMEVLRRMRVLCLIAILEDGPLASLDQVISHHGISSLYKERTRKRSCILDDRCLGAEVGVVTLGMKLGSHFWTLPQSTTTDIRT